MRISAKSVGALALGASLFTGLGGCDELPEVDRSRLPEVSVPPLPSELPNPFPSESAAPAPEPEPEEEAPEEAPEEESPQEPAPEPEPSESAPADAAAEDAADAAAEESPTVWWPWALAAVAALALLVVWWRWIAKRRAWDARLRQARSELSWFEGSLIAQILSKPSAAEASALWQAARPRVLDLDRELHDLEETAPNEERATAASHGLEALRGLTDAIDTEASTQAGTDSDSLRARRAAVESARARAQAWVSAGRR